jgi:hypothetical protein
LTQLTEEEAIDHLVEFAESLPKRGRFSTSEFKNLKTVLKENQTHFIFEPIGDIWGFSLKIYRHPPYPKTPPVQLVWIAGNRIPEELRIEEKNVPGCRLDDQFRELSSFSHNKRNEKLAKKVRFAST